MAALDSVLKDISAVARELGLAKNEENLIWSAHVQLVSIEISVGELTPERWTGGPIGDEDDIAIVGELLARLLKSIRAARNALRAHGPG